MISDAVLMLIWRCDGETLVIPMAEPQEGDDNLLIRMLVDALPERVKGTAEAAALRGQVADQKGIIAGLRVQLQEQSAALQRLKIDNGMLMSAMLKGQKEAVA